MATQEEKYRAEWDARALAEAALINNDPARVAAAGKAAAKLLAAQEKELAALRGVASNTNKGAAPAPAGRGANDHLPKLPRR